KHQEHAPWSSLLVWVRRPLNVLRGGRSGVRSDLGQSSRLQSRALQRFTFVVVVFARETAPKLVYRNQQYCYASSLTRKIAAPATEVAPGATSRFPCTASVGGEQGIPVASRHSDERMKRRSRDGSRSVRVRQSIPCRASLA